MCCMHLRKPRPPARHAQEVIQIDPPRARADRGVMHEQSIAMCACLFRGFDAALPTCKCCTLGLELGRCSC